MENEQKLKAAVLLMKYPGEDMWSATVPTVDGVLAEGETPEIATERIQDELKIAIEKYPNIREKIKHLPKFLITEVEL